MGFFDFLKSSHPDNKKKSQLEGQRNQSRSRFQTVIGNILNKGKDLSNSPTLTAQDLFGSQIQRLQDNANANANATKSALSRSLLARGGDNSGAASANLLRADQQANQQIGNITDRFNTLATKLSEARQSRGDRLLSRALSGSNSLLNTDSQLFNSFLNREAQKEQASKQRKSSLFGGLLSTAGSVAGALCWVAEEIYPEEPQKVDAIRGLLHSRMGDNDDMVGAFAKDYALKGDQWAGMIRQNPELRKASRRLMNEMYELSKAG